ncbi:MAG: pyridoxal-phosphate dependent enzyme [Bacteroidota bacterium]
MNKNELLLPSPLQKITLDVTESRNIDLFVKRDDLIHPSLGGNKWRKLRYNIEKAKKLGKNMLLTFGGAFSNHIYSTAAAGSMFAFKTIGLIRGEEYLPLNPTLSFCKDQGMEIIYISREEYRKKNDQAYIEELSKKYPDAYIVPEGGTNKLAIKGSSEILDEIETDFDYICCAVGTGGTMAGLIKVAKPNQKVLGFSALKSGSFLNYEIKKLIPLSKNSNWRVVTEYHFGGYAKWTTELTDFINQFYKLTRIKLDPIYTSKMFYGILDLIERGIISPNSKIVAIHSGGLQGIQGFQERTGTKLFD